MASKTLRINLHMNKAAAELSSRQFHAAEKARIRQLLTDEQVAMKVRNQQIDVANRKRVEQAMRSAEIEQKGLGKTGSAIDGATLKMGAYIAGFAALSTATSALSGLVAYFDQLRVQANSAAFELTGYREQLQELAALKGHMGDTGPELASQLKFRAQTLQSREAAMAMQAAGLGIGEVAIDRGLRKGKISQKDFEQLMIAAGKMQTMEGGSAEAYGKLAGLIPLLSKTRITAAQGEAKINKLFQLQQPGGFPNFSAAVDQYAKLSGLVQGGILGDEEAMSLLSAFSVSDPGAASTLTQQAVRAVSAGVMRSRGMKIDSSQDSIRTNEFFKQIGVTTKMDSLSRLEATGKHLIDFQKSDKGKEMNLYDYLMTRGFQNQDERNALVLFTGLMQSGAWSVFKKEMAKKSDVGETGDITKRFNQAVGRDVLMQSKQADLAAEYARLGKGAGLEPLLIMQKAAWAMLKDKGVMTDQNFEDWANRGFAGSVIDNFAYFGYHDKPRQAVQWSLLAESKRLGMPDYEYYKDAPPGQYMGDKKILELREKIIAAGGNPMSALPEAIGKMADRIGNAVSPVPPAVQSAPPPAKGNRP